MNRIMQKTSGITLYIMYCSNSIETGELDAAEIGMHDDIVKMISIPCSGKLDLLYMIKAFETGADGVVLLTCPVNKCHNLEGNLRANVRVGSVNSILAESGLDGERVAVIEVENGNIAGLTTRINDFIAGLKK